MRRAARGPVLQRLRTEETPAVFELQCVRRLETSSLRDSLAAAQAWALRHAGREPAHPQFSELARRYRVVTGGGGP
ncbi:hypothetical protein [Streptomyces sp. SPB162]|uniref:DUF7848 domain-containing protein n=1 Tax=Streptomyces sp. SPB162 TaxID=2940560 RepID=UPI002406E858|nr:hypothetical protein [Streptomyces sp. SPB162]